MFYKLFKIIISVLISLIIGLYCSQKPKINGKISHNHQNYGDVKIYRDQYGIPHIQANDLSGACYGQGYSNAQDRLFSMFIKKIVGAGRLSEFQGKKALQRDIYFRQLGIKRIAYSSNNFSKDTLECLTAYTDGINDYAAELKVLPLEFYLFGAKWENWTIYDSIIIKNVLCLQTARDGIFEYLRSAVRDQFTEQETEEIWSMRSIYQFINTQIINVDELKQMNLFENTSKIEKQIELEIEKNFVIGYDLINLPQFLYDEMQGQGGSNSFAVDGNFTENGKPIFEIDPHLNNNMPGQWSQVELIFKHKGKAVNAIGVGVAGIPGIIQGKNQHVAFGQTLLYVDTQDFYKEDIKIDEYGQEIYFVDGQYKRLKKFVEEIKVKNEETKFIDVYETHRGPLLQNYPQLQLGVEYGFGNFSLAWIGHIAESETIEALIGIMLSENSEDLLKISNKIVSTALALCFATKKGDIGVYSTGRIPVKKNFMEGAYFKDGRNSENDWKKFVKFEDKPRLLNPQKGFFVSANNKIAADEFKDGITRNLQSTARSSRIQEMIELKLNNQSGKKFNLNDAIQIQSDVQDIYVEKILQGIIKLTENFILNSQNEKLKNQVFECIELIEILKTWDCQYKKDSVGAGIYHVWEFQFLDNIFEQLKNDEKVRRAITKGFLIFSFIYRKFDQWGKQQTLIVKEKWCMTEKHQNCIDNLFYSLVKAKKYLENKFGKNVHQYQLGKIHTLYFPHLVFNKWAAPFPLYKLFDRSLEGQGSQRTPSLSQWHNDKGDFISGTGPNFRMIVSFGQNEEEEDQSYWIVDGGSSESIFNQHYDDQLQLHHRFLLIEIKQGEKYFKDYKDLLVLQFNEN